MVMLWTVLAVCVGLLQARDMPPWMRWQWSILLTVYVGYALLNLLLQSSFLERWGQFVLQLAMVFVCRQFLRKQEQETAYKWPKYTRLVVYLAMGMMLSALVANVFGRVMLAKFFGISAVFGLISAQALTVLVQLLFETFYLHWKPANPTAASPRSWISTASGKASVLHYICWRHSPGS